MIAREPAKTFEFKRTSGFFAKYMHGSGLDVGYRGSDPLAEPILPTAIGIDLDYPGYDGLRLPFQDGTQDYVFSSHCLEHIQDDEGSLREWLRVVKPGGHVIVVVPHCDLYEGKRALPSKKNADHKHVYSPASLLATLERAIPEANKFRICLLCDGDYGYDYSKQGKHQPYAQYEVTLVIRKL